MTIVVVFAVLASVCIARAMCYKPIGKPEDIPFGRCWGNTDARKALELDRRVGVLERRMETEKEAR